MRSPTPKPGLKMDAVYLSKLKNVIVEIQEYPIVISRCPRLDEGLDTAPKITLTNWQSLFLIPEDCSRSTAVNIIASRAYGKNPKGQIDKVCRPTSSSSAFMCKMWYRTVHNFQIYSICSMFALS